MNNLGLPIGADPSRDIPFGTDELGNQQFRASNGTIYSIRQQVVPPRQTQPGTLARVGEVAKGLLSDAIQGIASGVTAPRRALEGGDGVTGADALNLAGLLQLGGGAVAKPKGALGANALRQVDEYGGHHRAPRRADDVGAALSDPREMFGGEDIYTSNAMRYYGHGDPAMDRESLRAINMARSNPDAEVTVYRAIPKDLEGAQINAGDWVTPSRRYADLHGQGPLGGDYQIIKQKVRAGDLFTEGDIHEWGYDPLTTSANRDATTGAIALATPRNEAEAMARQILEMRAQGRAGDVTEAMMAQADPQYMYANTPLPMDEASRMARAQEMGFDTGVPLYHGSDAWKIEAFDPSKGMERLPATFFSESRDVAKTYGDVGEFFTRTDYPAEFDFYGGSRIDFNNENLTPGGLVRQVKQAINDAERYGADTESDLAFDLQSAGVDPWYADEIDAVKMRNVVDSFGWDGEPANNLAVFDPTKIRRTTARFDPEFSHLANLNAANVSPEVGLLATQPTDADKEAILRYLGAQGLLR